MVVAMTGLFSDVDRNYLQFVDLDKLPAGHDFRAKMEAGVNAKKDFITITSDDWDGVEDVALVWPPVHVDAIAIVFFGGA